MAPTASVSVSPVAVVGAGPTGLTAAVALAVLAVPVVLIGRRHFAAGGPLDNRTSALMSGAVRLLRNLGVWSACEPCSAPLWAIRMVDDTGRLFRAPDITFRAAEIGNEPFAWNVPNDAMVAALDARATMLPALTRVDDAVVTAVRARPDAVELTLSNGRSMAAALVVAADGRSSPCRDAAGIRTTTWRYDQVAIACNLRHATSHDATSTELHRAAGPCTVVPLPDPSTRPHGDGGVAMAPYASSLVWVERPEVTARLCALSDADFRRVLQQHLGNILGYIEHVGPRASFPLGGLSARDLAANRVALVGEAAHVVPPIGAQGLNLGIRDAATIADVAADAMASGHDPGAATTLAAYAAARRADIVSRTFAVDLLNRSLISGLLPLQIARGLGIGALNLVGPLRRLIMREGMQPASLLPALMR